jgi:hypothetical protein
MARPINDSGSYSTATSSLQEGRQHEGDIMINRAGIQTYPQIQTLHQQTAIFKECQQKKI